MTSKKNLIEVAKELNTLQIKYNNTKWLHVKTNTIYVIDSFVFDEHTQEISVVYGLDNIFNGPNVLFSRPFSEWEEIIDNRARFERVKLHNIFLTETEASNLLMFSTRR